MQETIQEEQVAEFNIQDLLGIGLTLIVLVIAVAYGLEVTGDVRDDMGESNCEDRTDTMTSYNSTSHLCYNSTNTAVPGSAEFNSTVDGIEAVAKIPDKLGMIVTVVIASVIIGLLLRYLYMRYGG